MYQSKPKTPTRTNRSPAAEHDSAARTRRRGHGINAPFTSSSSERALPTNSGFTAATARWTSRRRVAAGTEVRTRNWQSAGLQRRWRRTRVGGDSGFPVLTSGSCVFSTIPTISSGSSLAGQIGGAFVIRTWCPRGSALRNRREQMSGSRQQPVGEPLRRRQRCGHAPPGYSWLRKSPDSRSGAVTPSELHRRHRLAHSRCHCAIQCQWRGAGR